MAATLNQFDSRSSSVAEGKNIINSYQAKSGPNDSILPQFKLKAVPWSVTKSNPAGFWKCEHPQHKTEKEMWGKKRKETKGTNISKHMPGV